MQRSSPGFSLIELIVALTVVALVAVGAYLYVVRPADSPDSAGQNGVPETFTDNSDLQLGAESLDEVDIDTELDSYLNDLNEEAAAF